MSRHTETLLYVPSALLFFFSLLDPAASGYSADGSISPMCDSPLQYWHSELRACVDCTVCEAYLVSCGAATDAVCAKRRFDARAVHATMRNAAKSRRELVNGLRGQQVIFNR